VQEVRDHTEHLCDRFTEDSVIRYMTKSEESIRAFALELLRSKAEISWGAALLKSSKDKYHIWQENKEMLKKVSTHNDVLASLGLSPAPKTRPRGGGGQQQQQQQQQHTGGQGGSQGGGQQRQGSQGGAQAGSQQGQGGGQGGQGGGQGGSQRTLPATGKLDRGSRTICKKWQDQRGCRTLLVQTDTFMFATSSLRLLEVTSSAAAIIRGRGTTTVLTVRQPREVRK